MPSDKAHYIRLFASYYIKNPRFHVSEILNDNFSTYKQNELELDDILNTVKSDYLNAILYCSDKDIEPQKMFHGTESVMPLIFRLYGRGIISVNSLIAFHEIFGIGNFRGSADNIVEMDQAKEYRNIFDKYSPIVYNEFFKDITWKKEIQKFHWEINK